MTANFMKARQKFGQAHFNFVPESYLLPEQAMEFKAVFNANMMRLKTGGEGAGAYAEE